METQDILKNIDLSNSDNVKYVFGLKSAFNKALGEFHKKVAPPNKNGHVSFNNTKYDYVLFEDLSKAIDVALVDIDLTWNQDTFSDEEKGVAGARTIIRCESNGYEESTKWVRIKVNGKSQDIGSALTYAKRYSLSSAFGINSETDDDGQRAQAAPVGNKSSRMYKKTSQASRPQTQPKPQPNNSDPLISQAQLRLVNDKLTKLSQAKGTNADAEAQRYLAMVHLTKLEDLTSSQAVMLVNHLDEEIKQVEANKPQQQKSDDLDRWLENRGVTTRA
ncbi:ERF family protein [Pediococcus acidilactici]|uniref:ERF family protein n=1 Tax=Pediococcus acidilactici TaxID=1254 RepID=UPI0013638758|nr:ERF family protein [Pediococcus acidilactici]QHM53351.1 hypothetical protein C7M42_00043 [Pediococcus acidilactici]